MPVDECIGMPKCKIDDAVLKEFEKAGFKTLEPVDIIEIIARKTHLHARFFIDRGGTIHRVFIHPDVEKEVKSIKRRLRMSMVDSFLYDSGFIRSYMYSRVNEFDTSIHSAVMILHFECIPSQEQVRTIGELIRFAKLHFDTSVKVYIDASRSASAAKLSDKWYEEEVFVDSVHDIKLFRDIKNDCPMYG